MTTVHGSFEVQATPEPPFDDVDGVRLGRMRIDKRFSGPLTATSAVHMLTAWTPVKGSAAYVALERVTGSLDGREGSFVLLHRGVMERFDPAAHAGSESLSVTVVPDSGTGALRGLSGAMTITVDAQGAHRYALEYALAAE